MTGRKSPHYVAILTNNHVIANENDREIGAPIVQPGTLDGGRKGKNLIGEVWKFVRLKSNRTNYIDAALGVLYDDVDYDEGTIGSLGKLRGAGDVAQLSENAPAFKVGRTTGQTKGRITAFEIDNVAVEFGMGTLRFDGQIEIEGVGRNAFSDSGDSGSLVVDQERRAIGLLFAGGTVGGSNRMGLTYVNPIDKVLDALDVELLT